MQRGRYRTRRIPPARTDRHRPTTTVFRIVGRDAAKRRIKRFPHSGKVAIDNLGSLLRMRNVSLLSPHTQRFIVRFGRKAWRSPAGGRHAFHFLAFSQLKIHPDGLCLSSECLSHLAAGQCSTHPCDVLVVGCPHSLKLWFRFHVSVYE